MLRSTCKIWSKVVVIKNRLIFKNVTSPGSSKKLFVVIPEIATDQSLLNIDNLLSVSPYDIFLEVSKSIQIFDANITALSEKMNTYCTNECYDFDKIILELNKILEEIDKKFKFLKVISITSSDVITQYIAYNLFTKMHLASQQLLKVSNLSFIVNELGKKELNDNQRQIVEMMRNNFEMFGRYLPKDKMNTMAYNINVVLNFQSRFNASVAKSQQKLQQYFDRSDLSDNTPKWLLTQLQTSDAENSYQVDMSSNSLINDFLKYCKNPLIRNQLWISSKQIGGKIIFNFKNSNYKNINEIRNYRKLVANDFGEENYANFIFKTKSRMAKSLDDVVDLLEDYKTKIIPLAENEFMNLSEYAIKEKGLNESLMPWDINYIHHCFSLDVMKCPWSKLETEDQRFNLDFILNRIFAILNKIFKITFTVKHLRENEIVYTISSKEHDSELIIKIDQNRGKKFINILPLKVNNGDVSGTVSYVILKLPLGNPNFFNCLEIIGNLGSILSNHLGIDHFDVSPLHRGLPPDAANISSQFLLHCFLSSVNIFEYIFSELGSQKVRELSSSYTTKGINMLSNISSLEALYVAYFDIEMWLSDKSWQNVQTELWYDFFGSSRKSKLYFPLQKMDEWPCSATSIFSDHLWGGVKKYSLFWTDNIVKTLFLEFNKAKINEWNPNEEISPELFNLFDNFRKTFIEEKVSLHKFSI